MKKLVWLLLFKSLTGLADVSGGGISDYFGNPITSRSSGAQWPLDVGITVSGTVVDPRSRTWTLLNTTDSVNVGNFPATQAVTQSTSPWVISGTVSSTQGTSPWVDNITQFGGNNVVTGTGASGVGIPRVTVSNDSNILATQSGAWTMGRTWTLLNTTDSVNSVQSGAWTTGRTWTLSSGTDSIAAAQSGSWTVTANAGTNLNTSALALSATQTNGSQKTQVVDGSGNVQPSGDVLTRKIFVQPTDGSNNQGYTAASEAKVSVTQPLPTGTNVIGALTANQSVNVAQVNGVTTLTGTGASGTGTQRVTLAADGQKTMANSTAVVLSSDQTGINSFLDKSATGALTALNQTVTVATNGMTTAIVQMTGTYNAVATFECSVDNAATYFTVSGIYLNTNLIPINVLNSTGQVGFYISACDHFRVRISSFTSGTVNVAINTGTGSLANIATQVTRLASSMGEYITGTAITGTAANKQPVDVMSLSTGTAKYFTSFSTQQTAATAANASVFAMRNAAASTKTVIMENVVCRQGFNATNPVTRTQEGYLFQRFSAATPTGGTALTAGQGDSSDVASQVTDIRFLDTGLTTTGVTFVANSLTEMACDTTQGIECDIPLLNSPSGWKFAPGEGLVMRLTSATVTGVTINCHFGWREQ